MQPRTWIIENLEQMSRLCGYLPRLKDYPLDITVKEYVPKRSNEQNARLWKLHTMASAETGYTPEEMHELCLCQHFGFAEHAAKNPFSGQVEIRKVPLKRSSQRNKKEFRAFLDFVENYYADNLAIWLGQDD